jgi:hypothetical protein
LRCSVPYPFSVVVEASKNYIFTSVNKKQGIIPLLSVNQSGIWRYMADHRHKIPKKDQEKHFPNWDHGGKGDRPRSRNRLGGKTSPSDFADNWDRIFRRNLGED